MNGDEQNSLIDQLLDDDISEADFLRLEAEMHVNPEAREAYYDRLKLHTALEIEAEDCAGKPTASATPILSQRFRLDWLMISAAAALVLLAGVIGWKIGQDNESYARTKAEPVASGFGVIADQSNASWNGDLTLNRGDLLPQGPLTLDSGIAQLDLFSGVTLIIEGASEFEIVSAMEMSVKQGKVRVDVPEMARGFRIHTTAGDVVDLGTEFALSVTQDHADLHVLDGEIEWHPLSRPMQRLSSGESLRWTNSGEKKAITPSLDDLQKRLASRRDERKLAWQRHSKTLRDDPRLLVYFPMNQAGDWQRQLLDESSAKRNGTIIRAKRVSDRWEQPYGGLDFSPTGSRVRVNIPGEHKSITLMCWAKIDSLDRWYNSLFLTDGHELNEPHWQIMDDGRLFFSVKRRDGKGDKHIAYSPPIWTQAESGKWMHIATVYDGEAATTTHYINGEVISMDQIPENMQVDHVKIGEASIGNWNEPSNNRNDPHFAVRNLNGTIDEFAIFGEALTTDEIAELYKKGRTLNH